MDCLSRLVRNSIHVALNHWQELEGEETNNLVLLPLWNSHNGALREVEAGAKRLAQVILGASHLAQSAIPALLDPKNQADRDAIQEWKVQLRLTLQTQAETVCGGLADCHGLTVHPPQGAMYAMVEIDTCRLDKMIRDDVDFTKLLLKEENVFILPGKAFGVDSFNHVYFFRVVFCSSDDLLQEAVSRIADFCARHAR